MKFKNKLLLTFAAMGASLALSSPLASAKDINVVTSTDFYGEVAQAVLGKHGKVTSIISNSNVDPHDYEPTTKTAKTVEKADIVLYNGLGYDTWIEKLGGKKQVDIASDVMHAKDGDNEHLWYNSRTMAKTASYLATQYGKLDPKNKDEFKQNAAKYEKKLTKLSTTLAQIKKNSDNKKVAVSEPVFEYALDDMGYSIANNHFAKAIEDGGDPSFSDIKKLQDDIKKKKISFFVNNTQADSKVIKNLVDLCKKNNVPVVNVTETLPAKQNYISWMQSEYNQVLKIQEN